MAVPAGRSRPTGCGGCTARVRPRSPWSTRTTATSTSPGLLFVPFGLARPRGHRAAPPPAAARRHRLPPRPRSTTSTSSAERGSPRGRRPTLGYDVLVVATGAAAGAGGDRGPDRAGLDGERVHLLHPDGRRRAAERRCDRFDGGRLVVNVVDMPIKCPVAPLEFCFLADWYFHRARHPRPVELTYVTPLDGAFTKPVAAGQLGGLLDASRASSWSPSSTPARSTAPSGASWSSYDGREVPFDLAVVVPLHGGAAYVGRSPGPRRRARLRPDRRAHPAVQGRAERLRHRRRRQRPGVEGRLGHPLRGRDPRRERPRGSSPASRSTPPSTGTPTASSRPASTRRCSSTSTTTPNRCRATTRPASACRCCRSRGSTTSAS